MYVNLMDTGTWRKTEITKNIQTFKMRYESKKSRTFFKDRNKKASNYVFV